MATWEARAAKKKDTGIIDGCGLADMGMLCAFACFIPWTKIFSLGSTLDDPCCLRDGGGAQQEFDKVENISVRSNKSIAKNNKGKNKQSAVLCNNKSSKSDKNVF